MFAKSDPEQGGNNSQHCEIVGRPFLVASSNPAPLLETIEHALDLIPRSVCLTIERPTAALIALVWNGDTDATAT